MGWASGSPWVPGFARASVPDCVAAQCCPLLGHLSITPMVLGVTHPRTSRELHGTVPGIPGPRGWQALPKPPCLLTSRARELIPF